MQQVTNNFVQINNTATEKELICRVDFCFIKE